MSEYIRHHGDDYCSLTLPNGAELVMRYPDNEDREEFDKMVDKLNTDQEGEG